MHVVLLGDSTFDNAAYVGRGPDVRTQLQAMLRGSEATLLARGLGLVLREDPA